MQKNDVFTATITDMNILGYGIAKIDGAVVFVQHAVSGDEAKIRIIKCAKNYYVARIDELLIPSKDRIDSPCEVFHRCGGCAFQHIQYDLEKRIKTDYVRSCMKKSGVENSNVLPVISTGDIYRYRNKAQFPLSKNLEGMTVAGFYSAKTHRVCQVSDCSIQDSTFSSIVEFVLSFMNEKGIPPYSEEEGTGLVRHVYLRRGRVTDQAMLCLVLTKDAFPYEIEFSREIKARFPSIKTLAFNINPNNTNVILGEEERLLFGNGRIDEVLLEKTFSLSFRSFFQVNRDGAELLYRTAFSAVDFNQHDVIVDLYCGIGTIGLTVPAESDLLGVEIVPEAVRDAENNAKRNGRENADFICGDSAKCFQTVKEKQYKNPLVIVDPPRKGLSTDLILQFAQSEIGTILYISCNPETLARDLALFQKNGYAIADIQPVDMFPRTSHVESVVCLTRK